MNERLTEEQIRLFLEDYRIKTGDNLESNLDLTSKPKLDAFINRMYQLILIECRARPYFRRLETSNRLSEFQKASFWGAVLEQAEYVLSVGDFSKFSGFDGLNNSLVPLDELRKRGLSPIAQKLLQSAGLLYAGVVSGMQSPYLEERAYWGRMK